MSSPRGTENETPLAQCYSAQATLYARAVELTDELSSTVSGGTDTTPVFQRLAAVLADVSSLDSKAHHLRTQMRLDREKPSEDVRRAVGDLRSVLKSLVERVGAVEQLAAGARDRLLPEVSVETRRQRMRHAYVQRARLGST